MNNFQNIIYLDKEFISNTYEQIKGVSPAIKITKTETINAGIKALFMSAGASSVESKAYDVSTIKMLENIRNSLHNYSYFDDKLHDLDSPSKYVWVEGALYISSVKVTRKRYTIVLIGKQERDDDSKETFIAEEKYFCIRDNSNNTFALITSPDYFSSGCDGLLDLSGTVVDTIKLKVRSLLRVLPAKSSFGEWITIPLLIEESVS